jgi:hypothetical protein
MCVFIYGSWVSLLAICRYRIYSSTYGTWYCKCDHNLDPWRDDPEVSSGDEYGEDEQDEEVSFSLLILLVQYGTVHS